MTNSSGTSGTGLNPNPVDSSSGYEPWSPPASSISNRWKSWVQGTGSDRGIAMTPEFRRQLSRLLSTHWNIPFLNALQQEIGDDVFLAWLSQTFSFYSLPNEELAVCVKQQRSNDIAKMLIECGVNWAELVFKALAQYPDFVRSFVQFGASPSQVQDRNKMIAQQEHQKELKRPAKQQQHDALVKMENSQLKWSDYIAEDEIIHELSRFGELLKPQVQERLKNLRRQSRGDVADYSGVPLILLYGPPGTGKTFAVSLLASVSGLQAYTVHCSGIRGKLYGESESKMQKLFDIIGRMEKSLFFFDEVDQLATARSLDSHRTDRTLLNMFLEWVNGAQTRKSSNVVVCATNVVTHLDPAFLSRCRIRVKLMMPSDDVRLRWWQRYATNLTNEEHIKLSMMSRGMSFRDMNTACEIAYEDCAIRGAASVLCEDYASALFVIGPHKMANKGAEASRAVKYALPPARL